MHDLAIIGGGPAGISAGIYASRKKLKTVLIADKLAGQSVVSPDIQNWIGSISISGAELAKKMEDHLRFYAKDIIDIKNGEKAVSISKKGSVFKVQTDKNTYETRTLLIATGSHHKKLEIPGAKEFENKGITYCASCDGPLFADKDVVVIGGGNAGFETAVQLLEYTKSVTLLHRGSEFKADPTTVEKVLSNPKMKTFLNATIQEIKGNDFVKSIIYKDNQNGKIIELPAEGVFVEIGAAPATEILSGLVELNQYGQILTNPKNQKTSLDGLWAAGDCTDGLYRQNNISAGDGIKALEDIYLYLRAK